MDLIGKLKDALQKEFGITTDEELLEEVRKMPGIDLGIFVSPIGGVENAESA